jgi:hypothetical protein
VLANAHETMQVMVKIEVTTAGRATLTLTNSLLSCERDSIRQ